MGVKVAAALVAGVLLVSGCSSDGPSEGSTASTGGSTTTTGSLSLNHAEEDPGAEVRTADAIPVAHTPEGGYGTTMPPPILAGCTEPLVDGAPDLRGLWEVVSVEVEGDQVSEGPFIGVRQRIEQCGDRLVVTSGGVIHDMRVDGTEENGVHDVAGRDFKTPITVVATYEDGVHVLRPAGVEGIEITRWRDGDDLLWSYVVATTRSKWLSPPETDPDSV